jgi:hypothetical protein
MVNSYPVSSPGLHTLEQWEDHGYEVGLAENPIEHISYQPSKAQVFVRVEKVYRIFPRIWYRLVIIIAVSLVNVWHCQPHLNFLCLKR